MILVRDNDNTMCTSTIAHDINKLRSYNDTILVVSSLMWMQLYIVSLIIIHFEMHTQKIYSHDHIHCGIQNFVFWVGNIIMK